MRDTLLRAYCHAEMRDTIRPATWCLDEARIVRDRLTLRGWIVRADSRPVALTINGRRCDETQMGVSERPDVRTLYWYGRKESPGFEAHGGLLPEELNHARTLRVDLADAKTLQPLRYQQAFFVPPPEREIAPLPDAARIQRVHGSADPDSFRLMGYSSFHKLDLILHRLTGKGLNSMRSILDWGCGCGRLLRYCSALDASVTAVDIDGDNVDWCRVNLPFATYRTIPLHPPTDLPGEMFDLVIGISVFTHLREAVQFEWLSELRRILTRGAFAAVTIHGPTVTAASGNQGVWRHVRRNGFLDETSHDLDDVLADKAYYRTTFHSHTYIRREWSRYFDVIGIVPACIGNAQDLVILRAN